MRGAILAMAMAMSGLAHGACKVEALAWMSGSWTTETGGARVTETWLGPANGLMVAANLTAGPGPRKFYEFLRIAETPEGCSYFASPGGRAPVEFKVKALEGQRVVFENPALEFPQRILYWRDGEALMARVEGANGKFEEWRFEKR